MNEPIDIKFGSIGQKIYFDCPEGRPTLAVGAAAAAYEDIVDVTGTAETALTGLAVEAGSFVTDDISGAGESDPRVIGLTADPATLVVGRQYLIQAPTGVREWFVVAGVDTADDQVTAETPLMNAYPAGSTVKSTRIEATVVTAWAAERTHLADPRDPNGRYRGELPYIDANGIDQVAVVYFNLTRYPFVLVVTPPDVEQAARGTLARLHPDAIVSAGMSEIREARRQVRIELVGYRLSDSAQRNNLLINEAIRRKAVVVVAKQALMAGGGGSVGVVASPALAQAELDYEWAFNRLIGNVRQQVTPDGAGGIEPPAPLWIR